MIVSILHTGNILTAFIAIVFLAGLLIGIAVMVRTIFINPRMLSFNEMILKEYVFVNPYNYKRKLEVYERMRKRDKVPWNIFRSLKIEEFFTEEELKVLKNG